MGSDEALLALGWLNQLGKTKLQRCVDLSQLHLIAVASYKPGWGQGGAVVELAGVAVGCCRGPLGQPRQGEGGWHRLRCNRRSFVSARDGDSLFSTARQCYLPEGSRKGESLFMCKKLKPLFVPGLSWWGWSHGAGPPPRCGQGCLAAGDGWVHGWVHGWVVHALVCRGSCGAGRGPSPSCVPVGRRCPSLLLVGASANLPRAGAACGGDGPAADPQGGPKAPQQPWGHGDRDSSWAKPQLAGIASPFVAAGEREGWAVCPGSPPWLGERFSWLRVLVASALSLPRDAPCVPLSVGTPTCQGWAENGRAHHTDVFLASWSCCASKYHELFCWKKKYTALSLFLCAMNPFSCPWSFSTFKLRTQETALVCTTGFFGFL